MILEAMYNGEFYPCETVVPTSRFLRNYPFLSFYIIGNIV